jgi:hypothetical protein
MITSPVAGLLPADSAKVPADACGLLTRSEIKAVQRVRITDGKPSSRTEGSLSTSQCFYTAEPFAKSVSLELTQPGGGPGEGPRDQWQRIFHRTVAEEAENGKNPGEKGEKTSKPLPVSGVGEEAFWIQTGPIGALYVLKTDAYIRVSVGGGDAAKVKIDKSRALARKALKRLP